MPRVSADALRAFANGRRYSALTDALRDVTNGAPLGSDAPRAILSDEWANVKKIEKDIVAARDEYKRKRAELDAQGAEMVKRDSELQTLKARILRQLDVINTFINDPAVIDRIEEYDTVVAPGNLLNLRKLAVRLRIPERE